jgi:hypothetical protein
MHPYSDITQSRVEPFSSQAAIGGAFGEAALINGSHATSFRRREKHAMPDNTGDPDSVRCCGCASESYRKVDGKKPAAPFGAAGRYLSARGTRYSTASLMISCHGEESFKEIGKNLAVPFATVTSLALQPASTQSGQSQADRFAGR